MAITNIADKFINDIRKALSDDGFVEMREIGASLDALDVSYKVCSDLKAHVAQDLLDRSNRPRQRGGVPMADDVRRKLRDFVTTHDLQLGIPGGVALGELGLWLDVPGCSRDGVTRFVNTIRKDTANGWTLKETTVARALDELERADVSDGIKAHVVENLYLSTNAQRSDGGLPVSTPAAEALRDFYKNLDPQAEGLGWFRQPE